jgi:hypothetical protein
MLGVEKKVSEDKIIKILITGFSGHSVNLKKLPLNIKYLTATLKMATNCEVIFIYELLSKFVIVLKQHAYGHKL